MDSSNDTAESVRRIVDNRTFFCEFTRIALGVVLPVLIVTINTTILTAFLVQKLRHPTTVQVSPAGLLALNLIVADALLGAVTTFVSSRIVAWYPYLCGVRSGMFYLATIGSQTALINVVVDRFVAIAYTLHYRDMMTFTRSAVMVCTGWFIPLAGMIASTALIGWHPGTVARCFEIHATRMFLKYVWLPSHVVVNLCILVIQCRVYLHLRRHDPEIPTSSPLRRSRRKVFWILYCMTTPTCLALFCFDAVLIAIALEIRPTFQLIHDIILLIVYLSLLVNPVVYSYAIANIRKPVSALCNDIIKWLQLRVSFRGSAWAPAPSPTQGVSGVSVIGNRDSFHKSSSSCVFVQ